MERKANELSIFAGCLALGIATLTFGSNNVEWLGYGLTTLGGATTLLDTINKANPYKRLFENLNLHVGKVIPKYIRKRKTDYGYCVTLSLPPGLSTKDFDKHRLAIEQYLNKKIDIEYVNHRVFLKVFEKELDTSLIYEFTENKNILEFTIGVTFGGKIVKVDLEKAVHLLVAGETGSGKSTLLRGILTNIILANKRVSLHLIDLKNGAEFNVFRKCKVVKSFSRTIEEADIILSKLLIEVDRRYDLFYENNVVDIREYNNIKGFRKLDYQVVVIDEFADLQDEKGSISAVETLAAKARACGIHLIISTQRPDAKILNGRIKANVPGVIGLKTMNGLNSRIIIDAEGLEKLRGKGHGLLKYGEFTEFQSMFLSTKDARELIKDTYVEKTIKEKKKEIIGEVSNLDFIKGLKQ